MDFSLSSEQKLIFDTAYEFGQNSIAPYALEWENSLIPKKFSKRQANWVLPLYMSMKKMEVQVLQD